MAGADFVDVPTIVWRWLQRGNELITARLAKIKKDWADELARRNGKLGKVDRCKRRAHIWCSVRTTCWRAPLLWHSAH